MMQQSFRDVADVMNCVEIISGSPSGLVIFRLVLLIPDGFDITIPQNPMSSKLTVEGIPSFLRDKPVFYNRYLAISQVNQVGQSPLLRERHKQPGDTRSFGYRGHVTSPALEHCELVYQKLGRLQIPQLS